LPTFSLRLQGLVSVIGPGKAQRGLQSHLIDETLGGILRILCRGKQNARQPAYSLDGVYIAEIQGRLGVVVPLKSPVGSGDYVQHFAYQNSPIKSSPACRGSRELPGWTFIEFWCRPVVIWRMAEAEPRPSVVIPRNWLEDGIELDGRDVLSSESSIMTSFLPFVRPCLGQDSLSQIQVL
jgi:hypothetical protein